MIPTEIQYETYDGKLLAIVEAFKTWRHYLEGCKHEIFILMDYNNPNASWIQKVYALDKSVGLKNCQDITFRLIIDRAKLIELLISCHNTSSRVLRKKRSSELRI